MESGEESGKKSHLPYSNLKFCAGESQILENSIGLKYNNIFLAVLVFWDFFSQTEEQLGQPLVRLHQFRFHGINNHLKSYCPKIQTNALIHSDGGKINIYIISRIWGANFLVVQVM